MRRHWKGAIPVGANAGNATSSEAQTTKYPASAAITIRWGMICDMGNRTEEHNASED